MARPGRLYGLFGGLGDNYGLRSADDVVAAAEDEFEAGRRRRWWVENDEGAVGEGDRWDVVVEGRSWDRPRGS